MNTYNLDNNNYDRCSSCHTKWAPLSKMHYHDTFGVVCSECDSILVLKEAFDNGLLDYVEHYRALKRLEEEHYDIARSLQALKKP